MIDRRACVAVLVSLFFSACGSEAPQAPEHQSLLRGPIQSIDRPADDPHAKENGCLTCHAGLEMIRSSASRMMQEIQQLAAASGSNNRCIVCHGGDPEARIDASLDPNSEVYRAVATKAHAGTPGYFGTHPGPKGFYADPGSPWVNEHSCGPCHQWEVQTQWQNLMMTESGKIQGAIWGFGVPGEAADNPYLHRWANYDVQTLKGDEVVGTPAYKAYMSILAAKEPNVFVDQMTQLPAAPEGGQDVTDDPSLAAFTYLRGECQRCHLGVGGKQRHGDFRGLGCSACHIPYGNAGLYQGSDRTLTGTGRPLIHSMQGGRGAPLKHGEVVWSGIPVETCTTCHNRGRRIGVSFQGLMETPYASPWTPEGEKQQALHGKHYIKLHADLHKDKGFVCQDCHTTLDAHASGRLVGAITGAVEVECSDCHGTPFNYPWELPLGWMDEYEEKPKEGEPRGTVDRLPDFMQKGTHPVAGDGYLLTARGNPFGNVVRDGRRVNVHLASGAVRALLPLKFLNEEGLFSRGADVSMVSVKTHMNRMECFACHATWAPQCYGCHVKVDYREEAAHYDWISIGDNHRADGRTPEYTELGDGIRISGKIIEGRSYLRWEDPALAQNGEGRISPVIPGCQTTVTVINKDGKTVRLNHIARIPGVEGAGEQGQCGIDTSPLHPHTVQKKARSCESCHNSPKALGYGIGGGSFYEDPSKDHTVDLETGDGRIIPQGTTPQMQGIPNLAGDWSRFVTEEGEQLQTVGHHLTLSRPLNNEERSHMSREGVCLSCHEEIPDNSVAIDLLHHVAEATNMMPESNDQHDALLTKILLTSAWAQVLGGAAGGMTAFAALLWLLRRRRRRSR